ncbi:MAG: FtsX-like permease family protein [Bacteroidales bacterium]|nr:FtsX-like permease family protein [Bacteroidales bacterium]
MLLHYLKIAWRNLLKYKTQSVISILGLAIGFTAFSFTMSWIRYEMGYDSHNPDADRIYCIERADFNDSSQRVSYGLTNYLRKNFPEVEAACNASSSQFILTEEQVKTEWNRFVRETRFSVSTDTAFFSVFYPDVKVKYPYPLPEKAAIFTRGIAEKWNITPWKFGQNIDSLDLVPIAIVDDKPLQSNVAFRYMTVRIPVDVDDQTLWNHFSGQTYIRLHKGTSIDRIAKALDSLHIVTNYKEEVRSYNIYPLRKAHYLLPNKEANIKFEALRQFSAVALLVIICALLNYIMLFISRVKTRSREFALNKVNGASNKEILLLLATEFLMVLLAAIFVGGLLTELLFPAFSRFSMIVASKGYYLISVFWYSLVIIVVSTLVTFAFIYRFVRRTVRENIAPQAKSSHVFKISFSHVAIFSQLCIGILLIFCTAMVFNQYHLMDQRVGYNRNGLMVFAADNEEFPVSEIRKIAGVGDFIINSESIFSRHYGGLFLNELTVTDKEGKSEKYSLDRKFVDSNFRSLLEIPLLSGRDILPSDDVVYLINQTGARELGGDPIGGTVNGDPIIGVIPDLQVESPLVKIVPAVYRLSNRNNNVQMAKNIVFRSENDSVTQRVYDWFMREYPLTDTGKGWSRYNFWRMDLDELFEEYTKSERNLLMLISIITVVAILIAVFGIYSMITLSCTQRRKEIAIRKVNGAKAKEVFLLFFREYFVVTLLSSIVAFPIGVYIIQRWLEQYIRRATMEWWLFAGIFALITLIVFVSIFFRVHRAAKENPAEVVKSE